LFEAHRAGAGTTLAEPSAKEYAQGRTKYVRTGGGTPPPGATPILDSDNPRGGD
jgi:hypothetical protein